MDKLKIKELKGLARKNGLKGYSTLSKAKLIDFIEKAGVKPPEGAPTPQDKMGKIRTAKEAQKRENLLRGAAKREERKALPENIRYRDKVPAFTERKKVPIIKKLDGKPGKKMVPGKKKAVEITDLKGVKKSFVFTERKGKKKPKKITLLAPPANRFITPIGDEAELRAKAMKSIGKPNEPYRRDNVKDREKGKFEGKWKGTTMVLSKGPLKKKTKELRIYNKAVAIHEENQRKSHRKLTKLKYLTERDREKDGYRKPKKITELKGVGGKGGGLPKKDYNQLDTVETRPKPAFLISSYIDKPEPKRTSTFRRRSQMGEDERFFWDNFGYDVSSDED